MQKKPVIRVQTRYQQDLHKGLTDRARRNNRSLNGELMEILKEALTGTAEQAAFERGKLEGIRQTMTP